MSTNPTKPVQASMNSNRYSRQIRFAPFGEAGQERLTGGLAVIVGCGALGSLQASILVRAGVGKVRLVDRDFLELSNLQRQFVYDEADVERGIPKAIAAKEKLAIVNSEIVIESFVEDLNHSNVAKICQNADVILDGTDNFETRFLINDYSAHSGVPWVYGGCIGSDGQTMTILPGETSCLHCLMSDGPPAPGTTATCDTAGILAPIIATIASFQCNEALKILSGNRDRTSRALMSIGMWDNEIRQLDLSTLKNVECPVCDLKEFKWLDGTNLKKSAVLCGRNAVQLSPSESQPVNLADLEKKFPDARSTKLNPFMLQVDFADYLLTVFPDGRVIIKGTEDIAKAKSLYAQWIGS